MSHCGTCPNCLPALITPGPVSSDLTYILSHVRGSCNELIYSIILLYVFGFTN